MSNNKEESEKTMLRMFRDLVQLTKNIFLQLDTMEKRFNAISIMSKTDDDRLDSITLRLELHAEIKNLSIPSFDFNNMVPSENEKSKLSQKYHNSVSDFHTQYNKKFKTRQDELLDKLLDLPI